MTLVATAALNGFHGDASGSSEGGIVDLSFQIERTAPIIIWGNAMMAIFWLLAIGAAGVAIAIVVGIRPFETRHLAWLTALLFAYAAFRGTAPGAPPIGVFLDFGAFFWATAVIVTTELVLLGCYLLGGERWKPQ